MMNSCITRAITGLKSRKKIIFACGAAVLFMGILFSFYGYNNTWRLWNIPTMTPHFADLRAHTAGAESSAQGYDTLLNNPADPWQRTLNYPRIWQYLYLAGVDQSHTTYLGIGLIFLFLTGICLILPHAGNMVIFFVIAALLSPATLLGAERANMDMLMFFLAAVSIVTVKKWPVLATATVLLAFVLKLFPVFGGTSLLRTNRPIFIRCVFIIAAFVALYIALTHSELALIKAATPQSTLLTYGLNVLWMGISNHDKTLSLTVRYLSYLAVLLALLTAWSGLLRDDFRVEKQVPSIYLDAFRAGAAIYIGTFMLNNNWNHRLFFLILTVPQLTIWSAYTIRRISIGAAITLTTILLAMWYLPIIKLTCGLPYGCYVSFTFDQIFHWIAFSGLLYLLFWSMPDWLKDAGKKTCTPNPVRISNS